MQESREKIYSNNILNNTTISNLLEQIESERSDFYTVESSSVHSGKSTILNDKSSENNKTSSSETKEKIKIQFLKLHLKIEENGLISLN